MSEFADYVPPTKCCTICQDTLPLDAIHFTRDRASADGFRDECRTCRSEQRKQERKGDIDERLQALDKAALNMIQMVANHDFSRVPHVAEVFECLMRVFGGPQGFAEHYMGTYLSAKPGSQQRIKLLSTVTMLANQATQSGAVQVPKEYLSDEDLERELQKRLIRLHAPPADAKDQEVA